jgi:hypothetical protein
MVGAMLAKLSTRRYGAALEPVGDLPAKGTSKSTVSAKFVAATTERLAGLNRRPLDDQRWLIIFIDGFSFGQHLGRCAGGHRRGDQDPAHRWSRPPPRTPPCAPG